MLSSVRLPEEHFANGHDFFLTQISRVKSEKFPIKTQLGFFTVKLLKALNTMYTLSECQSPSHGHEEHDLEPGQIWFESL